MSIVRVVDFETTGFDVTDQVCEVGICDIDVSSKVISDHKSWLCGVNAMPPQVRAVHHISKADCDGHDAFDQSLIFSDKVSVYAAHNAEFEMKFFTPDKPMICTYKAALRVWPNAPSHSNNALRYWLEDQSLIAPIHEKTLPTHRAGPDAYVTAFILLALLNAGATGKDMVAWTKGPKLMPVCPIGKFKGKPWYDVEEGFLSWMIRQDDMEHDLKWNAVREINRRREGK